MGKSSRGARSPEFQPGCCWLTVSPQTSYFPSLGRSYHICSVVDLDKLVSKIPPGSDIV